MLIKLHDQTITIESEPVSADEIVANINHLLDMAQVSLDYLIIDGIEVAAGFENYLSANRRTIRLIEVMTKSLQRQILEQLNEAVAYLDRALPEVSILADEFYQGAKQSSWEKFDQLLEGIQWLAQVVSTIQNREILPNWDQFQNVAVTMLKKLGELGKALQDFDRILMADLFKYEIEPTLEELRTLCKNTLSSGEYKNALN
jgi:tetratricopeptide (TPR) repeat protein